MSLKRQPGAEGSELWMTQWNEASQGFVEEALGERSQSRDEINQVARAAQTWLFLAVLLEGRLLPMVPQNKFQGN